MDSPDLLNLIPDLDDVYADADRTRVAQAISVAEGPRIGNIRLVYILAIQPDTHQPIACVMEQDIN